MKPMNEQGASSAQGEGRPDERTAQAEARPAGGARPSADVQPAAGMHSPDDAPAAGGRLWRPVVAAAAAAALVFCGWSAWQYANGSDPLAFLSGDAFQTVAEPEAATPQISTVSTTVTADDVCAAAASGLSFDGADVSVGEGGVVAVISDGGIWVEQATTDDAAAMVGATARRAAALATWATSRNVGFTQVTWIAEDANGAVRMVVRYACGDAPSAGDETALLAAASGYAISGDAYAALGGAPAFAQSAGEAPALPDAAAVAVIENRTVAGEALQESQTVYRVVDENGEQVSSKSSSGSGGGLGSGSGSDGGSTNGSGSGLGSGTGSASGSGSGSASGSGTSSRRDDTITVYITVDGSAAGAGSSSATLTLPAGSTVYDAIASCGVSFNAQATGYGMYVSSIGGLAEKEHGDMSGWMYSVDGVTAGVACSSYALSGGESIYWWYANVEY